MNKWDVIFSSFYYSLPLWLMLIILFIEDGMSNEIFILAVTSMVTILRMGISLMRIDNLENEIKKSKEKVKRNEITHYE